MFSTQPQCVYWGLCAFAAAWGELNSHTEWEYGIYLGGSVEWEWKNEPLSNGLASVTYAKAANQASGDPPLKRRVSLYSWGNSGAVWSRCESKADRLLCLWLKISDFENKAAVTHPLRMSVTSASHTFELRSINKKNTENIPSVRRRGKIMTTQTGRSIASNHVSAQISVQFVFLI